MSKVEEKLCEDHQISMVEGKVETMMFTACNMRGNQDIVKTLWPVEHIFSPLTGVCSWRRIKYPLVEA